MIIILKDGIKETEKKEILDHIDASGLTAEISNDTAAKFINVTGDQNRIDPSSFKLYPGVQAVYRTEDPYSRVSRKVKSESSVIRVGDVEIGGNKVVVAAGPCAIENEEQIFKAAEIIAASGAKILRGGAFKPRTSPYSFQGLGEEGLRIMRQAADKYNLVMITEIMDAQQLDMINKYTDMLQVGSRNMQNYTLLREVSNAAKPVMLKRGFSATIEEWLLSAEYIVSGGNEEVILCERGIRTFETSTRNTFDVSSIAVVHEKSHLPVIADPSHASGDSRKVIPLARAGVAAGADGIMVEIHHEPQKALSDPAQALRPDEYKELMKQLEAISTAIGRGF